MLDSIAKLLVLQDRDRKLRHAEAELANIEPERQTFKTKSLTIQTQLDQVRLRTKQIESDRKNLELEVEAKQQMIERYSNQQLQTRKNEEYRALAHEIETCKAEINKIEDREIELMEAAEQAQKEVSRLTQEAEAAKKLCDEQTAQLGAREQNLKQDLAGLRSNREELAAAVDPAVRARYERLVRSRGENVLVGVQHGVCGGCHMKLPPQTLVACQSDQDVVTCNSCGRILYYTRGMVLAGED